MTAVFIHGNPDTYRVWDAVRAGIGDAPSLALELPRFGCPVPAGFTATKEAYVAWIIHELERHPDPVDLVGHDWGSLLTQRVASLRPDLVRTWASGGATLRTVRVWHDLAKIWQTPGAGEDWMAKMDAPAIAAHLIGRGFTPDFARQTAERMDALMKDCILKLYRSAVDVAAEWESGLANIKSPGLILWGEQDPFSRADSRGPSDASRERVIAFPDCGHWWQIERPLETAAALVEHWKTAA